MKVDTPAKMLLFCTVRITSTKTSGDRTVGTGFILDVHPGPEKSAPMLVTNKHVVGDADVLQFEFTKKDPAGDPILGTTFAVTITSASVASIGHPDPEIDVAMIPLGPILNATTEQLFYTQLDLSLFPTPEVAVALDVIEDVTFVGYPNGHQDPVHKTPLVRRGITATPITLAFGGRPVFLIDGSVFGGSSGSPVLIFNQGGYHSAGNFYVGGRILLVGIVAATVTRQSQLPLEVAKAPHTKLSQELNLGVVYNWESIDQTIDEVHRHMGLPRPLAPPQAASS